MGVVGKRSELVISPREIVGRDYLVGEGSVDRLFVDFYVLGFVVIDIKS